MADGPTWWSSPAPYWNGMEGASFLVLNFCKCGVKVLIKVKEGHTPEGA